MSQAFGPLPSVRAAQCPPMHLIWRLYEINSATLQRRFRRHSHANIRGGCRGNGNGSSVAGYFSGPSRSCRKEQGHRFQEDHQRRIEPQSGNGSPACGNQRQYGGGGLRSIAPVAEVISYSSETGCRTPAGITARLSSREIHSIETDSPPGFHSPTANQYPLDAAAFALNPSSRSFMIPRHRPSESPVPGRKFNQRGAAGAVLIAGAAVIWGCCLLASSAAATPDAGGIGAGGFGTFGTEALAFAPLAELTPVRSDPSRESNSKDGDHSAGQSGATAKDSEYHPIPEPQTWVIAFSGLTTLVGLQRLRRRPGMRKL